MVATFCVCMWGQTRPLWWGVVVQRFVGADRRVCPLLFAFYILSPCLRGTSDGVAEGVNCVFAPIAFLSFAFLLLLFGKRRGTACGGGDGFQFAVFESPSATALLVPLCRKRDSLFIGIFIFLLFGEEEGDRLRWRR